MLMKIGLLGGLGLIASLLALYWIQPDTNGGQALLGIVVFADVLPWPAWIGMGLIVAAGIIAVQLQPGAQKSAAPQVTND